MRGRELRRNLVRCEGRSGRLEGAWREHGWCAVDLPLHVALTGRQRIFRRSWEEPLGLGSCQVCGRPVSGTPSVTIAPAFR